jgi:predicted metal-dependent phosphotriesterase family hydrolase
MHEHLLSDLRVWCKPSAEPPPGDKVHPGMLGYLRWNALSVPDNLVLEDPQDTIDELQAIKASGGGAVVDLTLAGMGRRIAELPRISEQSGVTIAVGCGWHVEELHPPKTGHRRARRAHPAGPPRGHRRHRHPPRAHRRDRHEPPADGPRRSRRCDHGDDHGAHPRRLLNR